MAKKGKEVTFSSKIHLPFTEMLAKKLGNVSPKTDEVLRDKIKDKKNEQDV